jgi:hypothetical protein
MWMGRGWILLEHEQKEKEARNRKWEWKAALCPVGWKCEKSSQEANLGEVPRQLVDHKRSLLPLIGILLLSQWQKPAIKGKTRTSIYVILQKNMALIDLALQWVFCKHLWSFYYDPHCVASQDVSQAGSQWHMCNPSYSGGIDQEDHS